MCFCNDDLGTKAGTSLLEPKNVKLSNDAGTQILTSLQMSRVDATSFRKPAFDLLLPEGISLIHLPLKVSTVEDRDVEIQTISKGMSSSLSTLTSCPELNGVFILHSTIRFIFSTSDDAGCDSETDLRNS